MHLEHDILSDPDGRGLLVDLDVALLESAFRGHLGIGRRRRDLDLDETLGCLLVVVSTGREEHARGVVVEIVMFALRLEVERVLLAGHDTLLRSLPPGKATVAVDSHPMEMHGQVLPGNRILWRYDDLEALA